MSNVNGSQPLVSEKPHSDTFVVAKSFLLEQINTFKFLNIIFSGFHRSNLKKKKL